MQTLEMEKVYHVHNNGKYLGEFKTHLPIQEDTNKVVSVQIYKYLPLDPDGCHNCYYYHCGVVVEFHNIDNDDVLYLALNPDSPVSCDEPITPAPCLALLDTIRPLANTNKWSS
jgi:hypothetical protein